jgi:hypothetical protein
MTPMERVIISELIEDWAIMIGLELKENDMENILSIYEAKKQHSSDIQTILLDALYSLQEERVESQDLLLI